MPATQPRRDQVDTTGHQTPGTGKRDWIAARDTPREIQVQPEAGSCEHRAALEGSSCSTTSCCRL